MKLITQDQDSGILFGPAGTLLRYVVDDCDAAMGFDDWKPAEDYSHPLTRMFMFFSYPLRVLVWVLLVVLPGALLFLLAILELGVLNVPRIVFDRIRQVYTGEKS